MVDGGGAMSEITAVITLIVEILALIGIVTPIFAKIHKLSDGTKCQLRSEMLRIYYRNKDSQKIRQYEFENFVFLYEAYKALKGNSFIDKIYTEVKEWEVIS